jgi:glutamate-5-semialdehyde dehydrogenase
MTATEKVSAICLAAKKASPALAAADGKTRNAILTEFSEELRRSADTILAANERDMTSAEENGTRANMLDRLRLTPERISSVADGIASVASLPDPIGCGTVITTPGGLEIRRIRVPLGVVAAIFEARPNVSADIAALCIKSGNAAVLRGGREALCSNEAIIAAAHRALAGFGFAEESVSLISDTGRECADALMNMRGLVDLLIPRGSKGLIKAVTENSRVPVIETGAGNCHIYLHKDARLDYAVNITVNARVSRPSVCNSAESLLVHEGGAERLLPQVAEALRKNGVELRCCPRALRYIPFGVPATEEDYAAEYNDLIMSVKIVDSLDEAVAHINRYGTGHSDAIITQSREAASAFTAGVDSAAVYVNASTRFTDGGEFGLGAEVGISTQKLHARGPMGLAALTTEKFIVEGSGQIR